MDQGFLLLFTNVLFLVLTPTILKNFLFYYILIFLVLFYLFIYLFGRALLSDFERLQHLTHILDGLLP